MKVRSFVVLLSIAALAVASLSSCGGKKSMKTSPTAERGSGQAAGPAPDRTPATPPPSPERTALVLEDVHFDFDRHALREDALDILRSNGDALRPRSDVEVTIEGHCDERGTVEYNLALGQKRAEAAREYLVSYGITGSRLSTISYGEERPVDPRHTEAAWAANRRASFVVASGR